MWTSEKWAWAKPAEPRSPLLPPFVFFSLDSLACSPPRPLVVSEMCKRTSAPEISTAPLGSNGDEGNAKDRIIGKTILVVRRQRLIFLRTIGPADPSSTATAAGQYWFCSEHYSDAFPFGSPSLFSFSIRSPPACEHQSSRPFRVCVAPFIHRFGPSRCSWIHQSLTTEKVKKGTIDSLICF